MSLGSSPRVRGKLELFHEGRRENGLIPACAGKTSRQVSSLLRRRAHPRVCGENTAHMMLWDPAAGSSPRVRGKRERVFRRIRRARLIPACAGKTSRRRRTL